MDDNSTEQAIVRAGTISPRVSPHHINELVGRLEYVTVQPEGTTTTLCLAYLPGKHGMKFLLAQGTSACVSPENFNAQIGIDIAKGKAMLEARDKLWELEGYALFNRLNEQPVPTASDLPPHQQRVVDEKRDLDEKRIKLDAFFETPTYMGLADTERADLSEQFIYMSNYSNVLGRRIAAFTKGGA